MIGYVNAIALDSRDPVALGQFYQRVLGGDLDISNPQWVTLNCGMGAAQICFQLSPEHIPPTFPDPTGSQQIHLDIRVDDLDAGETQVLAEGARTVPGEEHDGFRVYLDPAGHTFCLVDHP